MPLAVSATTSNGASALVSTNERTWATYPLSRSRVVRVPLAAAGSGPAMDMAFIASKPVSELIGAAPAPHILIPL